MTKYHSCQPNHIYTIHPFLPFKQYINEDYLSFVMTKRPGLITIRCSNTRSGHQDKGNWCCEELQ